MDIVLATAPTFEPVTLQEAKDHLRIDNTDTDAEIEALITAARQYVEKTRGIALFTQTWDLFLDNWPGCPLQIPRPPLQSVTHVKYFDAAGVLQTLSASVYQVDTNARPGRLTLAEGQSWPTIQGQKLSAVQVRFVAGYGTTAASVWRPILQAMLLLIGHWYEHRSEASDREIKRVPMAVDALLAPFANVRF